MIVNIQSFLLRSNQNRQELLSVVHNRTGRESAADLLRGVLYICFRVCCCECLSMCFSITTPTFFCIKKEASPTTDYHNRALVKLLFLLNGSIDDSSAVHFLKSAVKISALIAVKIAVKNYMRFTFKRCGKKNR